jgi:hypothetical protein
MQTKFLLIASRLPLKAALCHSVEVFVNSSQTRPTDAVFLGFYLDGSVSIGWLA